MGKKKGDIGKLFNLDIKLETISNNTSIKSTSRDATILNAKVPKIGARGILLESLYKYNETRSSTSKGPLEPLLGRMRFDLVHCWWHHRSKVENEVGRN